MKDKTKEERRLQAAVLLSVDIESNFKLYSYRVISADNFLTRAKELSDFFLKEYASNKQPEVRELEVTDHEEA